MTNLEIPLPDYIEHQNLTTVSLLFVLLYILSLCGQSLYKAFFGPLSKFPGPKSRALSVWPLLSTTWNGTENLNIPALHREYGKVVRVGPNQLSFVGDGQVWKDVHGFRKNGQLEIIKDPAFYGQPINKTDGLITADGATHSRQRKIVSHAFSDKALKEQEPMLKQWAKLFKTKLAEQAGRNEKTNLLKMFNCTTFDIMGDLTFAEPLYMLENSELSPWVTQIFAGIKYGARIRAIKLFSDFSQWFTEELLFRIPSFRAKQLTHWRYTTERVDRRLAKTPDRPDLFTRILEKSQGPDGLTIQELYTISSLFMLAGTETTATALSGTMYHLLQNPEYFNKLASEIRSEFSTIEDLTLESLARLPVLEATLKEGIRMYPPVPTGLSRVSPPGGMMVGDDFVPEGTTLSVHHMSTYRNDDNFKHAYEFRPERWMGDAEFVDDKLNSFEPFSTGPRNCLGKNLAWHEMRLLLATLILHFDVKLCEESATWDDQHVFTLWEKPALICKLTTVTA